ncbi:uncharacterized protein LOC100880979 isoform X1 [Megachile rotundata]|uniref:uncharacterized protein LOC100880979 isoform X1 n=1 Tax=Megachile rotundata TaxID=143995 RepID=UPI003FD09778
MASSALTEKINKIRQLNEEIKRRHEEVEEDKKNAAKQNALVQMVPSTDWPERKEPPEFTNSPKTKQKPTKERHEYVPQSHSGEGRKIHSFAQGEGPPPDPKYNFLADSEREEPTEYTKETVGNRFNNKGLRGSFRKKIGGRENVEKQDNKFNKGNYKGESQSGYDAWRAERNRIDEDRISRQRTAEGNWLREWDNDKFTTHNRNDEYERDPNREHASTQYYSDRLQNTALPRFSNVRKKYKDSGRKYDNNNEHVNYNQGGNHRPYRGSAKNVHGNHDNRSHTTYNQHRNNAPTTVKRSESPTSEERTVIATDKSIKVTLNQSSAIKGPVMSIKVNSPSIAGTGRVGPRQRTRVTYSHSDVDTPTTENESFFRQKSFEDKSKGSFFNNQKFSNIKRSHSQKKKDSDSRPLYYQRKEGKREDDTNFHKYHDNEFRSYPQKDQQRTYTPKSPKPMKGNTRIIKHDASNVNVTQKSSVTDETNVENDVKTEKSDSLEVTELEHTEVHTIESSEMDAENKIANDIVLKNESEETCAGFSSETESLEHVDKEGLKKLDLNNENNGAEVVNNITQDLQENNNTSSETSNAQSKDVVGANENDEIVKSEEILPTKDDQQLLEQAENTVCKDSENEISLQETVEVATNNSVSPSETTTQSVIEVNDQSVCNNELVQYQAEKTNENDESSDTISRDITVKKEINVEDISNTNINTVEQEKEKDKDIINEKAEDAGGL